MIVKIMTIDERFLIEILTTIKKADKSGGGEILPRLMLIKIDCLLGLIPSFT
jgi:hypothetical protein